MTAYECLNCHGRSETLASDGRCPGCRSDAVLLTDFPETRDLHRESRVTLSDFPQLSFSNDVDARRFVNRIQMVNRKLGDHNEKRTQALKHSDIGRLHGVTGVQPRNPSRS